MAPFYIGYQRTLRLGEDDIEGIQILYGEKSTDINKSKAKEITDTKSTNDDICSNRGIDTMITVKNGSTYAFLGDKYWKVGKKGIEAGYPKMISDGWKGLEDNPNAAFTWSNGRTYFFKGSKYWRFSKTGTMDKGYPKESAKGFKRIPEGIDAALVWPKDNKIYFFKGSKYWKFDPKTKPYVDASYPKDIEDWKRIPGDLDSAMTYSNGKTYFFKSSQYYRYDNEKNMVDDSVIPEYPRNTGYWWFACKNSPLLDKHS